MLKYFAGDGSAPALRAVVALATMLGLSSSCAGDKGAARSIELLRDVVAWRCGCQSLAPARPAMATMATTGDNWPVVQVGHAILSPDGEDVRLLVVNVTHVAVTTPEHILDQWKAMCTSDEYGILASIGYMRLPERLHQCMVGLLLADARGSRSDIAEILGVEARRCIRKLAEPWCHPIDISRHLSMIRGELLGMGAKSEVAAVDRYISMLRRLEEAMSGDGRYLASSSHYASDRVIDAMMAAEVGVTDGALGSGRFQHPGQFRLELWLKHIERNRLKRLADFWDSHAPTRNVIVHDDGEVSLIGLGARVKSICAHMVGRPVSRDEFLLWCDAN